jgi:hypothetical protein
MSLLVDIGMVVARVSNGRCCRCGVIVFLVGVCLRASKSAAAVYVAPVVPTTDKLATEVWKVERAAAVACAPGRTNDRK